ncbi:hypothetical protein ACFYL6_11850 [Micromonospora sp. NPDC007208]|uniref:hypothetical protein n=1 Tax=Micromonospora sp. NPDC007208 TaxID=3364236 RepID=UPI00367DED1A
MRADGGLAFPHAQQAVRITRTRTIKDKTSRETAYYTMSLPAILAQPVDLGAFARDEWLIENGLHHVRDVTFREDAHRARTRNGPAVFATLRNTAIGYHRLRGAINIARHQNRQPPINPTHRRSHVTSPVLRNGPAGQAPPPPRRSARRVDDRGAGFDNHLHCFFPELRGEGSLCAWHLFPFPDQPILLGRPVRKTHGSPL